MLIAARRHSGGCWTSLPLCSTRSSILAEIQDEERQAQYVVGGADRVEHMMVAPDGSVDAFVRFNLVRADARRPAWTISWPAVFGVRVARFGRSGREEPLPVRRLPRPLTARRGRRTLVPQ
jgi:hypothetical protein